jgi:hypothetical protein
MRKFSWGEWAPFLMVLGVVLIGFGLWLTMWK